MQLFILFIQIAVGFFAAVGVYFFFSRVILDWYVQKKSSAVCKIYLFGCKSDPEYAVRFAESRFLKGDYAVFFDGHGETRLKKTVPCYESYPSVSVALRGNTWFVRAEAPNPGGASYTINGL